MQQRPKVGDFYVDKEGDRFKVLAVLEDCVLASFNKSNGGDWGTIVDRLYHIDQLARGGWTLECKQVKPLTEAEMTKWMTYWTIGIDGTVFHFSWQLDGDNLFRVRTGNAFRTREDAEAYYKQIMGE